MYYTVIKHSGHISLVFSNARRVLSQCNTRLRLLYLLSKVRNYKKVMKTLLTASVALQSVEPLVQNSKNLNEWLLNRLVNLLIGKIVNDGLY